MPFRSATVLAATGSVERARLSTSRTSARASRSRVDAAAAARVQDDARAVIATGRRDHQGRDAVDRLMKSSPGARAGRAATSPTCRGHARGCRRRLCQRAIAAAQALHEFAPRPPRPARYSTNTRRPGARAGAALSEYVAELRRRGARAADEAERPERRRPGARRADRRASARPVGSRPRPARPGDHYAGARAHDRRSAAIDAAPPQRSGCACSTTSAASRRRRSEVLDADPEELRAAGGLSREGRLPAFARRARDRAHWNSTGSTSSTTKP